MKKSDTSSPPSHGITRRGLMVVLSSPSGGGKSTISRRLLEQDDNLHLSISATTRKRRPGETEGIHYRFVGTEDFQLMVNKGEFLEHAKVFDHYYGTPRKEVEEQIAQGRDVLFDIDWQGTQQLAANSRENLVSVFILPPNTAELEKRLKKRAEDSDTVVARRMAEASSEVSHYAEYDYIIINRDIDESVAQVTAILTAERLKRERMTGLTDFVKNLRDGL